MDAETLDTPMDLTVVRCQGKVHCLYLNNHRIAGGKPWGGGYNERVFKDVTLRELAKAIPALRKELGLDYLGNPERGV